MRWILTCEHYSNDVPEEFEFVFEESAAVLETHRAYDLQVNALYDRLKPRFDAAFQYSWTRLLIEPNRSLHHRHLFSPFSLQLNKEQRARLISDYYQPYRNQVQRYIKEAGDEPVVHISVHSFTPVLGNQDRRSLIGLLYDPVRQSEKELASLWKTLLLQQSGHRARFNYPYRGKADGFTTYLRKAFPFRYSGLELEVRNDKLVAMLDEIDESLALLMEQF